MKIQIDIQCQSIDFINAGCVGVKAPSRVPNKNARIEADIESDQGFSFSKRECEEFFKLEGDFSLLPQRTKIICLINSEFPKLFAFIYGIRMLMIANRAMTKRVTTMMPVTGRYMRGGGD